MPRRASEDGAAGAVPHASSPPDPAGCAGSEAEPQLGHDSGSGRRRIRAELRRPLGSRAAAGTGAPTCGETGPDCFFHFTLEWYTGKEPADGYFDYTGDVPKRRATLGGHRGTLYLQTIADHIVFLFTRGRVHYDVSEHSFGAGTQRLLGAIVHGLEPIE